MKKQLVLFSALGLVTFASMAQVAPATNKGGLIVKGGVNLANITYNKSGDIDDANMLTSFQVGLVADLPLSNYVSLQPGLLYTGKGSKTEAGNPNGNNYYKANSNPMYVELPVNVVGKIPMTGQSNFYFGAGPYAAMGVAGKNKVEGRAFGVAVNRESDIVYSNDDPTTSQEEGAGYGRLKKFDYGFNVLAGFDLGKYNLGANYGYGLAKLTSGTDNTADDQNKHRVLSFTLGIRL